MTLTGEAILKADDLRRELVKVPEWGGSVWVRGLSGAEWDRYEAEGLDFSGKKAVPRLDHVRARLCALALCDESGRRLLSDGDVQALSAKSAAPLDRVFEVARRLSGQAGTEEAEKNSAPAPASASG